MVQHVFAKVALAPSSWQPWSSRGDRHQYNYCSSGCNSSGATGCALAWGGGSLGAGLRVAVATGRAGAGNVLGRAFCSDDRKENIKIIERIASLGAQTLTMPALEGSGPKKIARVGPAFDCPYPSG